MAALGSPELSIPMGVSCQAAWQGGGQASGLPWDFEGLLAPFRVVALCSTQQAAPSFRCVKNKEPEEREGERERLVQGHRGCQAEEQDVAPRHPPSAISYLRPNPSLLLLPSAWRGAALLIPLPLLLQSRLRVSG